MRNNRLFWIDPGSPPESFPELSTAMREPDGLLAVGGDLGTERLLYAYKSGIFPWYVDGQPILWWSPDPRCVLRPESFHSSRSLRRSLRRNPLQVTFNHRFTAVISACAEPRPHQEGTWITQEMQHAYFNLHQQGWAHSVEVWNGEHLVGGMYGLVVGKVFFGESMFSRQTDASKIAFLALSRELESRDFSLIDCQIESPHLASLGATMISRFRFREILDRDCESMDKLENLPKQPLETSEMA